MMTAKRLATSLCVAAVFSVGALASESPVLERIVASGKIRIGKKKPFSSPGTACARRKSACCHWDGMESSWYMASQQPSWDDACLSQSLVSGTNVFPV